MGFAWGRCTVTTKSGVGSLHLQSRWWAPGRVAAVYFQPEGREVMYPVPQESWEQALAVGSWEQAMVLVQREGQRRACARCRG